MPNRRKRGRRRRPPKQPSIRNLPRSRSGYRKRRRSWKSRKPRANPPAISKTKSTRLKTPSASRRRPVRALGSARQKLHFFELYRLNLRSHAHGLGEEIPDIRRGPEIDTVAVEADRANVETTESRSASGIGDRAFLSASHYGDFIPIVKAGNRGDHITVKTVRRGPGMYRTLPTAMALAKRIELVEGRGPTGFIHERLHFDELGIIRLINPG